MATFYLSRGDTGPALRYALSQEGHPVVDVTGATVTFSMAQREGAPIIYRAPAVIVTANPAVVEYRWQPGDADRAGLFMAQFEVTWPGGQRISYPNDDDRLIPVEIAQGAGWRPVRPGGTITWTLGDTVNQPIVLTDDDGQPLDLTDATVTIGIRIGAAWVEHDAAVHDPLIGEAWPDWPSQGLTPGARPMRMTVEWPDSRETDPRDYVLDVRG